MSNDIKVKYNPQIKNIVLNASEKVMRGVAIDIFGEVIHQSPVGNPSIWKTKYPPKGYIGGRFKGNWQTSVSKPASGELDTIDKSGAQTTGKMLGVVAKFKVAMKSLYLTNNLPYASRLAEGWSKQRPDGWIDRIVMKFQGVVNKVAKENEVK